MVLRSKYADKIPIIALFLHTQYPWKFKELAKTYNWTVKEIEAAREYLAKKDLKPYGEQ